MRRRHQSGQTLIVVIFISAIAALLVIASLSWAQSSVFQTAASNRNDIGIVMRPVLASTPFVL